MVFIDAPKNCASITISIPLLISQVCLIFCAQVIGGAGPAGNGEPTGVGEWSSGESCLGSGRSNDTVCSTLRSRSIELGRCVSEEEDDEEDEDEEDLRLNMVMRKVCYRIGFPSVSEGYLQWMVYFFKMRLCMQILAAGKLSADAPAIPLRQNCK